GSDARKSGMDAKSCTSMPSDRNRRPIEVRTSGSSSMTKTVELASGIGATQDAVLSVGPPTLNRRHCSPQDVRAELYRSLRPLSQFGAILRGRLRHFSSRNTPKFMEEPHCTRVILDTDQPNPRGAKA